MKQGKTLQELGRELQRQRNNRQDFLADTRSLEMTSGRAGSILRLSLNGKTSEYGVGKWHISRLQVALTFLTATIKKCSWKIQPVIQEMKGAVVESCEVTPTRLYLKVIHKKTNY